MSIDGLAGGQMDERPDSPRPHRVPPPGVRFVLATRNAHKVAELRAILGASVEGFRDEYLTGLEELALTSPVEDGVTFEENALLKARTVARTTGIPAIADDSGLIADVFGAAPGVFSARWAGVHGDDLANLSLLLEQLQDVPDHARGARFVCAAALVLPSGEEYTEVAEVQGRLLREARGEGGFGYDPIFQPIGQARSMAELSAAEKNAISHRGRAFRELSDEISSVLGRA